MVYICRTDADRSTAKSLAYPLSPVHLCTMCHRDFSFRAIFIIVTIAWSGHSITEYVCRQATCSARIITDDGSFLRTKSTTFTFSSLLSTQSTMTKLSQEATYQLPRVALRARKYNLRGFPVPISRTQQLLRECVPFSAKSSSTK